MKQEDIILLCCLIFIALIVAGLCIETFMGEAQ